MPSLYSAAFAGSAIRPSTRKRSPISSRLLAGSRMRPLRIRMALIKLSCDMLGSCPRRRCRQLAGRRVVGAEEKNRHSHCKSVGYLVEDHTAGAVGDIAVDFHPAID